MSDEAAHSSASTATGAIRLFAGLIQGLALYLLYVAVDDKVWPATNGLYFAPILLVALFIPILISIGVGNLRLPTLIVWAAAATVLLAGFAWYDNWHSIQFEWSDGPEKTAHWVPHIAPSFGVVFISMVGLFIGQSLIAGSDAERRLIPSYPTHFDVAWKLGLQLALSAVFVGVFWGVLELGAELFSLIDLNGFRRLIEHSWFAIPATTLASALSLHLTDVRAGLVRGARTLVLMLLAWLLPLMTVIVAAFLASLIVTGLEPLWKTEHAAGYLLVAAAFLVIFINAAYQDGHPDREAPRILRYSGALAGVILVPLAVIASYALLLRVEQYGWTGPRIACAACLIMAVWYAIGYAASALLPGPWLKHMERWNFYAALLVLAIITAQFSPIADPDRISVDSQVARLEAGKVKPADFDFMYLRWRTGRFGMEALQRLAKDGVPGANGEYVREMAKQVLEVKSKYLSPPPVAVQVSANVSVWPRGRKLPAYFGTHNWMEEFDPYAPPYCLRYASSQCDAFILDLAGDGKEEILFLDPAADYNALFAESGDGSWHIVGKPGSYWSCASVIAALKAGHFNFAPPRINPWRQLQVQGLELSIPTVEKQQVQCPN